MADDLSRRVALLRGVNVGGGNKVPMAELRAVAEGLGWGEVRSYIASGNLVFTATGENEGLAADLMQALAGRVGVAVPILVLDREEFRARLAACPYVQAQGNRVHGIFGWGDFGVDEGLRDSLIAPGEEMTVMGDMAWLHTPEGFGISALAEKLPKVLTGPDRTARNLNTIRKLAEMLDG